MTFFSTLFGDSKMAGALAFVIGLLVLALLAFLVYRMVAGRGLRSAPGNRSRQPRLGIVDAFDLDRQRQLVLVRRDNVEHLIMIGGPNDLLIEQAIVRGLPLSNGETRREPGAPAPSAGTANGGTPERTAPRMPTFEMTREPEREPEREPLRQLPREPAETGFSNVPPPSRGPSPEVAPGAPPLPMPPPRPSFAAPSPGEVPAAPLPVRPLPPPRPVPTLPPRPAPASPGLRPPPPPSRGPVAPPPPRPPMPPQPTPPAPVVPPAEPSAPPPPRPSVNIDSLEEEMAKLLGRPPSDPGKT
jgi:flagellar protein FliO/FliZ